MPEVKVKAISLWQPWASAIARGYKHFETRSWSPPAALIGQEIAIHASKRWTKEEQSMLDSLRLIGCDPCPEELPPLGCIVAVARLTESIRTEELVHPMGYGDSGKFLLRLGGQSRGFTETEYALGNYESGRFAWGLSDVVRVANPIPCVGRQGFFDLPDEVMESLKGALVGSSLSAGLKLKAPVVVRQLPAIEPSREEDNGVGIGESIFDEVLGGEDEFF